MEEWRSYSGEHDKPILDQTTTQHRTTKGYYTRLELLNASIFNSDIKHVYITGTIVTNWILESSITNDAQCGVMNAALGMANEVCEDILVVPFKTPHSYLCGCVRMGRFYFLLNCPLLPLLPLCVITRINNLKKLS